jgi:hypothetical protein
MGSVSSRSDGAANVIREGPPSPESLKISARIGWHS